jgi:hypothetical protein
MLIFIPTLIICVNLQCEFQQAQTYYLKERECLQQIELQKQLITAIAATEKIPTLVEGTCITARVNLVNADLKTSPHSIQF